MLTKGTNYLTVNTIRHLYGFANGLRSPSMLVSLKVDSRAGINKNCLAIVSDQLNDMLCSLGVFLEAPHPTSEEDCPFDYLIQQMHRIHQAANVPIFETGRIIGRDRSQCLLAVPFFWANQHISVSMLNWLLATVNCVADDLDLKSRMGEFPAIFDSLKYTTEIGANVPRFLRAAFDAGIPTEAVAGNVIQYGQGARSRWLDSSVTDTTPYLSVILARNKLTTATVLRQAGIPVPPNALVKSKENAIQLADRLGYPVVVKPADKDGGVAVAAGLASAAEVASAYTAAQAHSNNILVEKHVEGRDYRLDIFQGEVLTAIERIPAGVTGDGKSTVENLVDVANSDPRRSEGRHALLKKLCLDEEALTIMASNGLNAQSVPHQGEFVPLRRKANIGMGGTPIAVKDKMHPDNSRLAIRAAEALHLDIAGVDLLMPDISRSWKEGGAAICEVNGKPQLGGITSSHVYGKILSSLVQGNGRIPIALVLGASADSTLVANISERLHDDQFRTGFSDRTGVTIAGECIHDKNVSVYAAGQMLMRSKAVEVAILSLNDFDVLRSGLPFDRFDMLILAGRHFDLPRRDPPWTNATALANLLRTILPACTRKVVTVGDIERNAESLKQFTSAEWVTVPTESGELATIVAADLLVVNTMTAGNNDLTFPTYTE